MSATLGNPAALSDRDINVSPTKASSFGSAGEDSITPVTAANAASILSNSGYTRTGKIELHRDAILRRMAAEKAQAPTYVSPSDTIMSPCTAKLSAYKNKRFMKAKPNPLFAKMNTMDAQMKKNERPAAIAPTIATTGEMLEQEQGEMEQQEEDRK